LKPGNISAMSAHYGRAGSSGGERRIEIPFVQGVSVVGSSPVECGFRLLTGGLLVRVQPGSFRLLSFAHSHPSRTNSPKGLLKLASAQLSSADPHLCGEGGNGGSACRRWLPKGRHETTRSCSHWPSGCPGLRAFGTGRHSRLRNPGRVPLRASDDSMHRVHHVFDIRGRRLWIDGEGDLRSQKRRYRTCRAHSSMSLWFNEEPGVSWFLVHKEASWS